MENQIRIYYDQKADYLEVRFTGPRENYGDDINEYLVIFRDEETDEIIGFGVFNFKKHTSELKEVLDKMNISMPINISA